MSETEKQHVYVALYGYGFRIERYELVKETAQCVFVKATFDPKKKILKQSDSHLVCRTKDEAVAFLTERIQRRIETHEKEISRLQETAAKPFRITDESVEFVRHEGPLKL